MEDTQDAALGVGLAGLRVLSLESRRAEQMAVLIQKHGGVAISAPSMREVPLEENPAALDFAERLLQGRFDAVLLLTGVGTRYLLGMLEPRFGRERLLEALGRTITIVRGPKPAAVLREWNVPIVVAVPEPNTWRDVLKEIDRVLPTEKLAGKRIAVQEYGESNDELLEGLAERGAVVTPVPVYRWALPEDIAPLEQAIGMIAEGAVDVLLVTSAVQVHHLMQFAERQGRLEQVREQLRRGVIASVGPVSSEALLQHGLQADLEPSHPKMGQLVFETAQQARKLLAGKRSGG